MFNIIRNGVNVLMLESKNKQPAVSEISTTKILSHYNSDTSMSTWAALLLFYLLRFWRRFNWKFLLLKNEVQKRLIGLVKITLSQCVRFFTNSNYTAYIIFLTRPLGECANKTSLKWIRLLESWKEKNKSRVEVMLKVRKIWVGWLMGVLGRMSATCRGKEQR